MSIEQYSGIGANTPMTGFGGTSGFGSPNYSSNTGGGGGFLGGFGNFLNSNFMSNVGGPLLSAGLSGIFTNRAADNYGRSAREAALLGGQAALLAGREAGAFSLLGEDLAQKRRQEDAIFQLNMQKSQPFQDLVTRGFGMQIAAQDKPGSEMRAGRFMTMFG
jgi:hypothetical protein